MFHFRVLAGFVCAALIALVAGARQDEPAPNAAPIVLDEVTGVSIVKGQLLVTLHDGITADDLKPVFERLEAKFEVVERIASLNCYTLATDHDRLAELRQRLENHPFVAAAAFNSVTTASTEKLFNDPVFKKPAEMPEDKDNWNLYRIKAPDAWEITTGGAAVAVIDAGVMLDHEDLVGRTKDPFSFATGGPKMQEGMKKIRCGPKAYSNDEVRNHGTHVSITIAGNADNGVGTVGVAPKSMIVPLQALFYQERYPDEKAGIITGSDADIVRAMGLAVDRGAATINMSIGNVNGDLAKAYREAKTEADREEIGIKLLAKSQENLKVLAPAFDRANKAGAIVVVAAGNDEIPAEYGPYVLSKRSISVAATTRDDKRAGFSNYGSFTAVSAPGHEIWSGFAEPGKPYAFLSGTSMACPHAAGVVALMKTIDPGMKLPDASAILIKTGRKLETDRPIGPLINARAALEETRRRLAMGIREPELPPLVPPPAVNPKAPELPKDGEAILRKPAPWDDPNVRRIIRAWLAIANPGPPAGGDGNLRWFFNLNGQRVNNRNAGIIRRPVWAPLNYRYLWENAGVLDSKNAGSLFEFAFGTLKSGKFDPAPTRIAERFRPTPKDLQPRPGGLKIDPALVGSKWSATNGKGEKVEFELGDKTAIVRQGGKETKYLARLNPYVHPMTLDLFPEGGGDPIRTDLNTNDLEDFALQTDLSKERPVGPAGPNRHKFSRSDRAPVAIGFQEGDGKSVDARFAGAKVSDGTAGLAGGLAKLGGSTDSVSAKSAVEWDKVIPGNPISGSRLVIREFKDAAGPAACVAHAAKLVSPATENLKVVTSDVAADHVTDHIEINVPNVLQQSVLRVAFVHRERYLVWIELYEGKVGAFNGEAKKLSESAKKLIDTRFPK